MRLSRLIRSSLLASAPEDGAFVTGWVENTDL